MNAIAYLIRKEIKNTILGLFHHPARLAGYLVIFLLFGFSIIQNLAEPGSFLSPAEGSEDFSSPLDFRILEGAYLGLLLLLGLPSILSGLKEGTTFFKMGDVNHLFCAPISSKIILAYGLLRQAFSTFVIVLFFSYYGVLAAEAFHITFPQILFLLAGLAASLLVFQLLALAAFSFCSGRPGRVRGVKVILGTLLIMLVLILISAFLGSGGRKDSILAAVSSPALEYIPVFGWMKGIAFGFITGDPFMPWFFASCTLLLTGGALCFFLRSRADYYEDVLQATETIYERQQDLKTQKGISIQSSAKRNRRLRSMGLKGGWGASAFFFKHLCEMRRRSSLLFISGSTFILAFANLLLYFFLSWSGAAEEDPLSPGGFMMVGLALSSYILFFLNADGAWSRELKKPWIFLVPASSLQKLLWAAAASFIKPLADGAVVFLLLGIAAKAKLSTILICILLYASMGIFYTAGNVFSMRVFGSFSNRGLLMALCSLALFLLFLPGIAGSFLLIILLEGVPAFLAGLPSLVWNLVVSALIFVFCREVFSSAETTA